ncbi:MAG: hypothetical protein RL459_850 [Pseudomonadota bacterium]
MLVGMMAFMLYVFSRINGRMPGLPYWVASYAAGFLFCLIGLTRFDRTQWLLVSITVTVSLLMPYFSLRASLIYLGKRLPSHLYAVAGIGTVTFLSAYFTAIEPKPGLRFVLTSVGSAVLFLLNAKVMASGNLRNWPARRLYAWFAGIHGLFLLFRPLLFKISEDETSREALVMVVSQFVVLEATFLVVLMAFAILLLGMEHVTTELKRLSDEDSLTGIYNRRAFLRLLEDACKGDPATKSAVPILLVDIDHFKKINDTYGHLMGDEVLRHFVKTARMCLRQEDVIGRLGGEEFAVFTFDNDLDKAAKVAERLRTQLSSQPAQTERGAIHYTVSIGVTLWMPDETITKALHRADEAMYLAKRQGRNRVEVVNSSPTTLAPALGNLPQSTV